MPDFKAAIFDLDGTILDSMWLWDKIDVDFFAKRDITITDDYSKEISAKSFRETAEYTIRYFHLDETAEDVMDEWANMAIYEYTHNVRLKPYAKDYLLFLKKEGIKLGAATSLTKALYEVALKNNGILDLFDAITSADEVKRGKEFPDIYILAAKKIDTMPKDCIVYDDILNAIAAIKSAGMKACGVYDKLSRQDIDLMKKISDMFIYSFEELLNN
ncbi:MAG: HAD family phosphatase [Eubacteriales bacterium]